MNTDNGDAPASGGRTRVRTFTATERDVEMLEAVARYHGFSKSATIRSLVHKEFWRLFPAGNGSIEPDRGARVLPARPVRGRGGRQHG